MVSLCTFVFEPELTGVVEVRKKLTRMLKGFNFTNIDYPCVGRRHRAIYLNPFRWSVCDRASHFYLEKT
jgi:hypothetical protein